MGRTTIIPLGGLGEIGRNALAVETDEALVLVDYGLQVSRLRHLGVDHLIPDPAYLRARKEKVRAVLLTHGHDDHAGGIPHLLRELPVPVYGTPMALALLEAREPAASSGRRRYFRAVAPGDTVDLGPFRASWIRVTHSAPESCALAIETPGGVVLHTGDFTFDPAPVDGRLTDVKTLGAWGDRGVDLLCCDSINAPLGAAAPSEKTVGEAFQRLLPEVRGRAYVALFASHAHRIQQVIEASRDAGRRVTLLGRTPARTVAAARRLGHLRTAPGDLVPEARSRRFPRSSLTVVLGGSQAEPGSALWRLSRGLEPHHRIRPGDHVFLSARLIPGNEIPVRRLADRCTRLGATVHWGEGSGIHVSGHPSGPDVARMIRLTRPRHLLPVHGELPHLLAAAGIGSKSGMGADQVHTAEDGEALILEKGELRPGPRVACGPLFRQSRDLTPLDGELLATRRRLAREGVVLALALRPAGPPGDEWDVRLSLEGVVPEAIAGAAAQRAEAVLRRHLADACAHSSPRQTVEREIAGCLRRHFRRLGGREPAICAIALSDAHG